RSIWVESSNEAIEQIANSLLETIQTEDDLYPIVRSMCKMGDDFSTIITSEKVDGTPGGIARLKGRDAKKMTRVEDENGRLVGFRYGDPDDEGEETGITDKKTSSPWDYAHFRLLGSDRTSKYGYSYIAPVRREHRRLQMMEDAMAIYRIKRAPDRFVFEIKGLDELPPEERVETFNKIREAFRKRMSTDPETGQVKSDLQTLNVDQDFFLDADSLSITKLPGSAVGPGQVLDVDYVRKRVLGILRIPPDYLGFSDSAGGFLAQSPLCLTGDTKIPLADGRERTILELLEEYGSEGNFWVYSCRLPKRRIVPGRAHGIIKTGEKVETLRVILDNGEEIKCTPGHPFLLSSGRYVEAKDLKPGHSLTALYRKESTIHPGYEETYDYASRDWQFTHRLFNRRYHETARDTGARWVKGNVIHHEDYNKRNNSPDNLMMMCSKHHHKIHSRTSPQCKRFAEFMRSPAGREMARQIGKKYSGKFKTYNGTAQQRVANLCRWLDPDFRDKMKLLNQKRILDYLEKHKNDPDHGLAGVWKRAETDPALREKMVEACRQAGKKSWPKFQKAGTEGAIRKWNGMTDEQKKAKIQQLVDGMKKAGPSYHRWTDEQRENWKKKIQEGRRKHLEKKKAEKESTVMNHKVLCVVPGEKEDVYDFTVDDYHNFATSAGVFVHNSNVDVNFSPQLKRIQRATIIGYTRLIQIHLAWLGIDPDSPLNDFVVKMTPCSFLDELQRAQLLQVRATTMGILVDIAKALQVDDKALLPYLIKLSCLPASLFRDVEEEMPKDSLAGAIDIIESKNGVKELDGRFKKLIDAVGRKNIENFTRDAIFRHDISSRTMLKGSKSEIPEVKEPKEPKDVLLT
ncbi:MAG: portal protein, partial [Bacteriovoracaceae bacterium]